MYIWEQWCTFESKIFILWQIWHVFENLIFFKMSKNGKKCTSESNDVHLRAKCSFCGKFGIVSKILIFLKKCQKMSKECQNMWTFAMTISPTAGHKTNLFLPILLVTILYFEGHRARLLCSSMWTFSSDYFSNCWSQNKPFFADFAGHIFVLQRYFDFCSVFDTYRSTIGVSSKWEKKKEEERRRRRKRVHRGSSQNLKNLNFGSSHTKQYSQHCKNTIQL